MSDDLFCDLVLYCRVVSVDLCDLCFEVGRLLLEIDAAAKIMETKVIF